MPREDRFVLDKMLLRFLIELLLTTFFLFVRLRRRLLILHSRSVRFHIVDGLALCECFLNRFRCHAALVDNDLASCASSAESLLEAKHADGDQNDPETDDRSEVDPKSSCAV